MLLCGAMLTVLDESLAALERTVRELAPEVAATLLPGAHASSLVRLERLGAARAELETWFRWHDGQPGGATIDPDSRLRLLPLREALSEPGRILIARGLRDVVRYEHTELMSFAVELAARWRLWAARRGHPRLYAVRRVQLARRADGRLECELGGVRSILLGRLDALPVTLIAEMRPHLRLEIVRASHPLWRIDDERVTLAISDPLLARIRHDLLGGETILEWPGLEGLRLRFLD
jgi:hypothetical protein